MFGFILGLTIKNFIYHSLYHLAIVHQSFWRDVVLHNQMWIKTIQIERHNPLVHTNLRVFYICTFKLFYLFIFFLLWNNYVFLAKVIVNNIIPITNRTKNVCHVHLGIIRHSETQFNKAHLIFKFVNKFNVSDIIFNE